MTNLRRSKKAQSALEYSMVIICLIGALLTMQIYIKRSMQGRTRDAADEIGEQYSARHTTSSLTQTIANPQDVTTTGKPEFIDVEITDATGAKRIEKREVMVIERKEPTKITIEASTPETTEELSREALFE